jgi:hypothetical protein
MRTVRDNLLSQSRKAWLVRAACFFVVGAIAVWVKQAGLDRFVVVPVLLILVAIFMPLGAYFARCPNCKFPFEFMGRVRLKCGARKYRTNFCPHCGLDLERQHQPGQNS